MHGKELLGEQPEGGVFVASGSLEAAEAARRSSELLTAQRSDIVARLERLPFSRTHFRVAAILSAGTFFDAFDGICIATALTVIFTSLHIGFMNTGLVFSSSYMGQFVGAWVFGVISERYGRKIAFVSSLFIFGVLSIATALAWNFSSLIAIRVVQGLGLGGEIPAAAVLINEMLRSRRRGRIGVIYASIYQWGSLLTPIIGLAFFSLFGERMGWRYMFAFGGIPVIVAVYAWFRLPESPRWLAEHGRYGEADALVRKMENQKWPRPLDPPEPITLPPAEPSRFGELFGGIYRRRTLMVWAIWFCTYVVALGFSLWLPTLYVKVAHLSVKTALALSIVPWTVGMLLTYAGAFLVDRIGRKAFMATGFLTVAVACLAGSFVLHAWHTTAWQVIFCIGMGITVGSGFCTMVLFTYTSELYPTRIRGVGVAASSSILRLAGVIAPAAVGACLSAGLGIAGVFAIFGATSLLAALIVVAAGVETREQSLETLSP